MDELLQTQRVVLVPRDPQDRADGEVCQILGITEGNMRVISHCARLRLRRSLFEVPLDL